MQWLQWDSLPWIGLAVPLAFPFSVVASEVPGVVIDEVSPSLVARGAEVLEGDVLTVWHGVGHCVGTCGPGATTGGLASPLELLEVEREQASRGPVVVEGWRGDVALRVELPAGYWGLVTRPTLPVDDTELYQAARLQLAGGEVEGAVERLRQLATRLHRAGRLAEAAWMAYETADALAATQRWGEASAALHAGLADAHASGDRRFVAWGHERKGALLLRRSELAGAAEQYRRALALREQLPGSVAEIEILTRLGRLAIDRGDFDEAQQLLDRALVLGRARAPGSLAVAETRGQLAVIFGLRSEFDAAMEHMLAALETQQRLAPHSVFVVQTLNRLGLASRRLGRLADAETYYRAALGIQQTLDPMGFSTAVVLTNLGVLATRQGRLRQAEGTFWRSLEIFEAVGSETLEVAGSYANLGGLLEQRGHLAQAEHYHRLALDLIERLAPASPQLAIVLDSLGNLALACGDPAAARSHFERALHSRQHVAPDSLSVARSWRDLGRAAAAADQLSEAEALLRRALAIEQRVAPEGLDPAASLTLLGEIAARRGRLQAAASLQARALAIHQRLAPGTVAEALVGQRLAGLFRRLGRGDEARRTYAEAVSALEAQAQQIGGSHEERSGFAAASASLYAEAVDLLVEQERLVEAFHLLERSRGRAYLELLGQRDLHPLADLPPDLAEQKRQADAHYDQILGQLARGAGEAKARTGSLAAELRVARRRQEEVAAQIRALTPGAVDANGPEPLDLEATRVMLDPGTLLLSYAVGEQRSHLLTVGPGEQGLRVFSIAAGERALRRDVAHLGALLRPGEEVEAIRFRARQLGALLLGPVADAIARADRLLVLPAGPLHTLPFAVLIPPAEGDRFLVDYGSVTLAASATIFAEVAGRRRTVESMRLSAFGDPLYPGGESFAELRGTTLRAALDEGFRLDPLPASRHEVQSLAELFSPASRVFVGAEATEERAKALASESNLLHFACHGLVDERYPLESALVLSLPAADQRAKENGLLQAWEIFEQLHLDADLVTLSACDSARGRELGNEGILGLTRAFRYAGARSVLSSLWAVNDHSTTELMKLFYKELQRGTAKDAALRTAQLAQLHGKGKTAHPYHWAAFQLFGDWR